MCHLHFAIDLDYPIERPGQRIPLNWGNIIRLKETPKAVISRWKGFGIVLLKGSNESGFNSEIDYYQLDYDTFPQVFINFAKQMLVNCEIPYRMMDFRICIVEMFLRIRTLGINFRHLCSSNQKLFGGRFPQLRRDLNVAIKSLYNRADDL